MPYLKLPALMQFIDVKEFIQFMIAGNDDHLLIVPRSPGPESMRLVVGIAKIPDVSGKHKNICRRDKRIILQPFGVFSKFKMQVGCVLNFRIRTSSQAVPPIMTKLSEYSLNASRNVSKPPTILFDLSCILLLFQLLGHGHHPVITLMTGGRRSHPRSMVRISKSLSVVNLPTHL